MGLPPTVPPAPLAQNPPAPLALNRVERLFQFSNRNAEWMVSIGFVVALIIWLLLMPRPESPYVDQHLKTLADTAGPHQADYQKDFDIWNQYHEYNAYFKWGSKVNLYLYSSLKTLAIILSAITPALIVAPSLKDKKVLAALPAVIVAVATGLIGEFDFKDEVARFDEAKVAIQDEKALYVAGSYPFYSLDNAVCTPTQETRCPSPTSLSLLPDISDVPFLSPKTPTESRANFAYRIDKIRQTVAAERERFLRGISPNTATPGKKDAGGQPSTPRQPSSKDNPAPKQ